MSGYVMPSKSTMDEMKPEKRPPNPVEADDYILYIEKVELKDGTEYQNPSKRSRFFGIEARIVGLKGGGFMTRVVDKSVAEAFKPIVFGTIGTSINFTKSGAPSKLRSFISIMEGKDPNDAIDPRECVVLTPQLDEVVDVILKKQIIDELSSGQGGTLTASGYKVLPDIRPYQGLYIGAKLIYSFDSNTKKYSYNKIESFSKLPQNFDLTTFEQIRINTLSQQNNQAAQTNAQPQAVQSPVTNAPQPQTYSAPVSQPSPAPVGQPIANPFSAEPMVVPPESDEDLAKIF